MPATILTAGDYGSSKEKRTRYYGPGYGNEPDVLDGNLTQGLELPKSNWELPSMNPIHRLSVTGGMNMYFWRNGISADAEST